MTRRLRVLVTRQEIPAERLEEATVVVVDVFLATSTLLTILERGARRVFPVGTLEEAEALTARLDDAGLLRGGEQGARPVEGFDCGPYPEEYSCERVRGRDVLYLSTNGTAAIADAAGAARLLVASLRNAPAVARHLNERRPESVYIVCAGSMGRLALDDFVGAAYLLSRMDTEHWKLNDGAWLAKDLGTRRGRLMDVLRESRSGRWFVENGREGTFEFVADVGATEIVAEVRDGQLVTVNGDGP